MMTFQELRSANVKRCAEAFPMCADWTPNDWMTALTGEVGETANLLKKLRRGDSVSMRDVADELADVQIYLDLLAAHLGVDLEHATISKFNEVSRKKGATTFLRIETPEVRP